MVTIKDKYQDIKKIKTKTSSLHKHFLYLLFDFGILRSAFSLSKILRLTLFWGAFDLFPDTLIASQVKTNQSLRMLASTHSDSGFAQSVLSLSGF